MSTKVDFGIAMTPTEDTASMFRQHMPDQWISPCGSVFRVRHFDFFSPQKHILSTAFMICNILFLFITSKNTQMGRWMISATLLWVGWTHGWLNSTKFIDHDTGQHISLFVQGSNVVALRDPPLVVSLYGYWDPISFRNRAWKIAFGVLNSTAIRMESGFAATGWFHGVCDIQWDNGNLWKCYNVYEGSYDSYDWREDNYDGEDSYDWEQYTDELHRPDRTKRQ